MEFDITVRDLLYGVSLLITLGISVWRLSTVLGNINTQLALIESKLHDIGPKMIDMEARIREIERNLWKRGE